ncbi:lycopene beta-cyclase CrtY [Roseomonas hellenica]|uniref:Lycopene beta-cyclase CrtY n=1 Tax=Plastoroseomonas hellenica TaxID=2687306 RepID=A0ABS5EWR4_9PROT|nr:lycopene beta-cyclase CrtY [Plastoroseomonas hellenica]MBR0664735.1 lycopene beta-cyclase CrtY [Plastoroseomonas hellenica]
MPWPANPEDGPSRRCDVLLLGGGLANGLLALELRRSRPALNVVMLERRRGPDRLHTWCMFRPDAAKDGWSAIEPYFERIWSGYTVAFPEYRRRLGTEYGCLTGAALYGATAAALGANLVEGAEVLEAGPDGARLADGRSFLAPLVIDGRGWRHSTALRCGWQKFVGLECRLEQPHGLDLPMVMDAEVEQADGFRFLYLLPLGPDRLLIEDTRYSAEPELDLCRFTVSIRRHAGARGWRIAEVLRREEGVLPVVLGGDFATFLAEQGSVPAVGARGGFFHPTTGYSLARAIDTAALIATAPRPASRDVATALRQRAIADWRGDGFYRVLNRMLFQAAAPAERYRILQRFYRLPQPLIERFYGGRLTLADKARILLGRPPVPILAALRAVRGLPQEASAHA